jgi:hypothetical protein
VQQPSLLGCFRHHDHAGAGIGRQRILKLRTKIGARREFEDLGAGVEQQHLLELEFRAVCDPFHFIDIAVVEGRDDRQEFPHHGPDHRPVQIVAGHAGSIERDAAMDPLPGLPAILHAAFVGSAGNFDEWAIKAVCQRICSLQSEHYNSILRSENT